MERLFKESKISGEKVYPVKILRRNILTILKRIEENLSERMSYLSQRDNLLFHSSDSSSIVGSLDEDDRPLFLSERDGPRPIVIPADGTPWYIIITVTFIILFAFIIWMIFLIKTEPPAPPISQNCPPGQCATNIYTGIKNCPATPAGTVSANLETEVCNSPYNCQNPETPYALQPDGGTNSQGVCLDTTATPCRCLSQARCPRYIATFFQVENGDAYDPNYSNQGLYFSQENSFVDPSGNIVQDPPFVLSNPLNQLCQISSNQLDRTYPRLIPLFSNLTTVETNSKQNCLGGILAYIPDNIAQFNISNEQTLNDTLVGCVTANFCSGNGVPVWDKVNESLVCF